MSATEQILEDNNSPALQLQWEQQQLWLSDQYNRLYNRDEHTKVCLILMEPPQSFLKTSPSSKL